MERAGRKVKKGYWMCEKLVKFVFCQKVNLRFLKILNVYNDLINNDLINESCS